MTFATTMNATLTRIMLMTGTETGKTLFESELQTVKITSEHIGVPNVQLAATELSLRYVPRGSGTVTVYYRSDEDAEQSVSFTMNPRGDAVLGSAMNPFSLAGAGTTLKRPDEDFTQHETIELQGKTLEFRIVTTPEVDTHIIGLEVGVAPAGTTAEF